MDSVADYFTPKSKRETFSFAKTTESPASSVTRAILCWKSFKNAEASSGRVEAEEQAGVRARRSTTKQIFNLRILCEKYLQHQQKDKVRYIVLPSALKFGKMKFDTANYHHHF